MGALDNGAVSVAWNSGAASGVLEGPRVGAAVEQHVLPDHVGGLLAAEKGADLAELLGRAEAPDGNGLHTRSGHLLVGATGLAGGLVYAASQSLGIEGAGEQIVEGDVATGQARLARGAGDESGQPAAGAS